MIFQWLDVLWRPHTVGRFSGLDNAQLDRFNSRFWTPGIEAIDAFTCDWVDDNNWWVPPVHLIPRVIRHAQRTNSQGTLIVPKWLSPPFWPLLFPNGVDLVEFVMAWTELPQHDWLILPGAQVLACSVSLQTQQSLP